MYNSVLTQHINFLCTSPVPLIYGRSVKGFNFFCVCLAISTSKIHLQILNERKWRTSSITPYMKLLQNLKVEVLNDSIIKPTLTKVLSWFIINRNISDATLQQTFLKLAKFCKWNRIRQIVMRMMVAGSRNGLRETMWQSFRGRLQRCHWCHVEQVSCLQWKPAMAHVSLENLCLRSWFFVYCIIRKLHDKITTDCM